MFDQNGDSPTPTAGEANNLPNVVNNPVPPLDPAVPNNVVTNPISNGASSVPSWAHSAEPTLSQPVTNIPNLQEPELPPAPPVIEQVPVLPAPVAEMTTSTPVWPPPSSQPSVPMNMNTESVGQGDIGQAARTVVNLYLDHRLKLALGQEPKLEAWEETTKKFPSFAQKIHDLGEALRDAEKIKKESFPEADSLIQRINFHNLDDEASRMLLTDVLWRRATSNTGKFNRDLNLPEESVQMLKEMEVSEEAIDSKAELSPREIVEKILSGKLRISPHLS